ncbi:hypothetical protein MAHJHV34_37810 [Mycobacterium avium subsp. hominissuis]
MFTGITSHTGALVTAVVVLTGAALLSGGAAAADPGQDDQFLALLDKKGIPPVKNVASLIVTAHKVCRKLDGGMPVDALVDEMVNNAYRTDPARAPLRPRPTCAHRGPIHHRGSGDLLPIRSKQDSFHHG